MTLAKRKKIRLQGYDYSQSGYYFITICTKNRASVLSKIISTPIVGDAPPIMGDAPPIVGDATPIVGDAPPIVGDAAPIVGDAAYGVPCTLPVNQLTEIGKMVEHYILNIDKVYKDVSVDKFVIMPNHVHLIIKIMSMMMQLPDETQKTKGTPWAASPTVSIHKVINSLKTLTSKQFGNTLWQRSYYDHIIRNEQEYRKIWEYIDTNPLKWEHDKYYLNIINLTNLTN